MKTERLIEVLTVQSETYNTFRMFAYIVRFCKRNNLSFYNDDGNIYITKGEAILYPCIVAHTDTVHDICEDLTVLNVGGNLTGFNRARMQQTGIGGDDKVGIFIALECLLKYDCIKVAFFRDEETGCEGSYNADMSFFNDCSFVLQCDRKGKKDFITSASGVELSGKDFQTDVKPFLKSHKYKFENGMMTDVMALKESGLPCSCANISCGYYNPHCTNEFVNIKDVFGCLSLVCNIIENLGQNSYYHKYESIGRWKDYGKYDIAWNEAKKDEKSGFGDDLYEECTSCGNITLDTEYCRDFNCWLCTDCFQQWENSNYNGSKQKSSIEIPF